MITSLPAMSVEHVSNFASLKFLPLPTLFTVYKQLTTGREFSLKMTILRNRLDPPPAYGAFPMFAHIYSQHAG
jgi:hypothetical protein